LQLSYFEQLIQYSEASKQSLHIAYTFNLRDWKAITPQKTKTFKTQTPHIKSLFRKGHGLDQECLKHNSHLGFKVCEVLGTS